MDIVLDALFRRLNKLNSALDRAGGRGVNRKMRKIVRKIDLQLLSRDDERRAAAR